MFKPLPTSCSCLFFPPPPPSLSLSLPSDASGRNMAMLKNLCRVKTRHSSWKYSPSLSSTEREEGREREEQTRGKLTNGSFDAAWFRSTSELSFVSRTPGIPEERRRRRYIGEGGWLRCLIYIYKKKESTRLQLRNRDRRIGESWVKKYKVEKKSIDTAAQ